MRIQYYGHSCFSIHICGKHILFDPFIVSNEANANYPIEEIKPDYIFITHGHWDHTADALSIVKGTSIHVVSNWGICEWFKKQGHENVHHMNIGGFWNFEFGTVQMVSAVHSSSMPDGTYAGSAAGFVFTTSDKNFYYSGDTALTLDMQLIPLRHKLDLAFLPIGNNFTMDIIDAIEASNFIKCNNIIGMHYDTFGYITINHQEAIDKFKKANKTLNLLNLNQIIEL